MPERISASNQSRLGGRHRLAPTIGSFLTAIVLLLFLSSPTNGQSRIDVVHFKNGSILKGEIVEQSPGESLIVEVADGNRYVLMVADIARITTEETGAQRAMEMPRRVVTPLPDQNVAMLLAESRQPRGSTRGVGFMLHLNGASAAAESAGSIPDESETESGGGLGLGLSAGVSEAVGIIFALDASLMNADQWDEYTLVHVDLGLRITTGSANSSTRFYFLGALTGRGAGLRLGSTDYVFTGGAGTIGIGLLAFFSPAVAFDVGLSGSFGSFSDVYIDGDRYHLDDIDAQFDATTVRFTLGVSLFP